MHFLIDHDMDEFHTDNSRELSCGVIWRFLPEIKITVITLYFTLTVHFILY